VATESSREAPSVSIEEPGRFPFALGNIRATGPTTAPEINGLEVSSGYTNRYSPLASNGLGVADYV